jgi:hypothetical protein
MLLRVSDMPGSEHLALDSAFESRIWECLAVEAFVGKLEKRPAFVELTP